MSTPNAKNTTKSTTVELSIEDRLSALELVTETLNRNQDRTAQAVGDLDQRILAAGTAQTVQQTVEALAPEAKKNLLAGLKQTTTTRKVVIATVATAAVAGTAYGVYRGVEIYKDRKALNQMADVLNVAHVESPSTVSKQDAIRQGLGVK